MIILSIISIFANSLNDGGVITTTNEGAYTCLSVDEAGDTYDAWQRPVDGILVVTPNQVIVYTDEHNIAMACERPDLIDVDCVDQTEGLLSPSALMEALGDIRRNRSDSNCPQTCGCDALD